MNVKRKLIRGTYLMILLGIAPFLLLLLCMFAFPDVPQIYFILPFFLAAIVSIWGILKMAPSLMLYESQARAQSMEKVVKPIHSETFVSDLIGRLAADGFTHDHQTIISENNSLTINVLMRISNAYGRPPVYEAFYLYEGITSMEQQEAFDQYQDEFTAKFMMGKGDNVFPMAIHCILQDHMTSDVAEACLESAPPSIVNCLRVACELSTGQATYLYKRNNRNKKYHNIIALADHYLF